MYIYNLICHHVSVHINVASSHGGVQLLAACAVSCDVIKWFPSLGAFDTVFFPIMHRTKDSWPYNTISPWPIYKHIYCLKNVSAHFIYLHPHFY